MAPVQVLQLTSLQHIDPKQALLAGSSIQLAGSNTTSKHTHTNITTAGENKRNRERSLQEI